MIRTRRRRGASFPGEGGAGAPRLGPLLRWMAVLSLGGVVIAGVRHGVDRALQPGQFPVRQIEITGELRQIARDDLQQALGGLLGQNFLVAEVASARAALAQMPWVAEVRAARRWPDALLFEVEERVPFARWGERQVVDVHGQRFEPSDLSQAQHWPVLNGPEGRELEVMRHYLDAARLLSPLGLKVARIDLDGRRAWSVTLADGLRIDLGRDGFLGRLQRFVSVYPTTLRALVGRIESVDLRYMHGLAVRWSETSLASGAEGARSKQTTGPAGAAG